AISSYVFTVSLFSISCSFFTLSPPTGIDTLSLHDALPIWVLVGYSLTYSPGYGPLTHLIGGLGDFGSSGFVNAVDEEGGYPLLVDRKSTRLNSSHVKISYAVFCLKKKIIRICRSLNMVSVY